MHLTNMGIHTEAIIFKDWNIISKDEIKVNRKAINCQNSFVWHKSVNGYEKFEIIMELLIEITKFIGTLQENVNKALAINGKLRNYCQKTKCKNKIEIYND